MTCTSATQCPAGFSCATTGYCSAYFGIHRSQARDPAELAHELQKMYGPKLAVDHLMVVLPGLKDPLELDFEGGKVKSARTSGHSAGRMKMALNRALH